ncbi:MAG: alanine--glyoxylate aminotransferase family protein [Planctomycetes bacterium]|nr:alanine--glyoxylate aminotransferase family protein [Planctomycetota bacterium]
MTDRDHPILFIPGPVEVDAELREIMAMPLVGHRSAAVQDLTIRVCAKLREFYCAPSQHAFFENAPGTALMEAAIRNLVVRRSLHLVAGAFAERWVEVARSCGRQPVAIQAPWGTTVTADEVRAHLRAVREPYEAVCVTHSETSTGALHDIAGIARAVRDESPGTLVLVDAVTSVGGAELRFDAWGIDLAFAGTQKCLALPPGLVTFAISQRALHKAATVEGRGFLLDLAACPERFAAGKPPATPCVPLVFALDRQLDRIATETLEARWARHRAMRSHTIAWAEANGFEPFVAIAGERSPTVSTLRASGARLDGVIDRAKAAGFTVGKGYGSLKSECFRIGHMGDHPVERLDALLAAITPPAP